MGRTGDARDTNAAEFGSVGKKTRGRAKQQE
jgi:hypothetical protein